MIAKDIQSLLSEKIQLEKESQNTDYNMSVKKTEQHSLQSEYDTLSSTLKQLTNQKDVAQKRLDDLDTQVRIIIRYLYFGRNYLIREIYYYILIGSLPPSHSLILKLY